MLTRHSLSESRASEPAPSPCRETFPSARILVAEDNPVNQKLVRRFLEKLGSKVDMAENGRQAVEMWIQNSYDMIFMDCQMPVMDGYKATIEIRNRETGKRRRTPIVALTANTMQGDHDKCLAVGMDDFIAKPFKSSSLQQALERWITSDRQTTEALPPALVEAHFH